MQSVYRVLAFVIAGLVAFQSAVIVFAVFGLATWIEQGGVLDASSMGNVSFTGDAGFMLHAMGGTIAIPLVGVVLLIISFFAKIPGGVKWALIVFGTIVVQVALGTFAHGAPALGLLHGIIALALFGLAVSAGMRVKRATAAPVGTPTAPVVQ